MLRRRLVALCFALLPLFAAIYAAPPLAGVAIEAIDRLASVGEAQALTPGERALLFSNKTIQPTYQCTYLAGALCGGESFSRAGNATMFDAAGKLTYAPNNLVQQSRTLATSPWSVSYTGSGVVPVVTNNGGVATDGTNTASLVELSIGAGSTLSDRSIVLQAFSAGMVGQVIIMSVDVKAYDAGSIGKVIAYGGDAFNFSTANTVTLTGSYQTVYVRGTYAGAGNVMLQLRGSVTSQSAKFLISNVVVSAVTYETTPRAADQVVTTSAAYYGPRLDYDPATLQPVGLGIWDTYVQRLYPSQIDTQWSTDTTGNMAFSFNDAGTLAPDGTQTATLLTATGADGYVEKTAGVATSAGSSKKSSVWIKRKTGTGQIDIVDSDLAAWHAVTLGSGWTRVEYYKTSAGIQNLGGIRIRTSGDAIWAWGYNVTDGPVLYPTQPATSGPVTVAADVVQLTGTPLAALQGAQGAAFVETGEVGQTVNAVLLSAGPPTKYAIYYHGVVAPWAVANYNGSTALDGATKASLQSAIRAGVRWSASGRAVVASGGTITGDANTLSLSGGIWLGSHAGVSNFLNGHVRSVGVFNRSLPDAQFKAKSTEGAPF